MHTWLKTLVLSVSTAVVALPAMAAPHDHHQAPQHQSMAHASHPHQDHPARQWKVGHKVPKLYHSSNYKVDHHKFKKLSQPGKHQQWIKVKGDYVLTDVRTHTIVKIITG